MGRWLEGQAVPRSNKPGEDTGLNIEESAEAIVPANWRMKG